MTRICLFLSLAAALSLTASGQPTHDSPILTEQGLVFPDGARIPRFMTEVERLYWERNPPPGPRGGGPTPTEPFRAVAEYEPMDGLCISWEGGSTLTSILAQMARHITDPASGNANLYVACDSTTVRNAAITSLTSTGTDMSRVSFIVRTMDSVWIRDYGPRYIYEGECRAIVDHVYNRPRPNDNTFPIAFSTFKHHAIYQLPLVHGGGNYHLDANGGGFCTRLVNNENNGGTDLYNYTEQQIHDLWMDYQACDTHFFDPFPTTIDSTQHIDMWMQVAGDTTVVISDWPAASGSTQDLICDNAAVYMASRGFTVHRVPAFSVSGVHYTYTNVVICNDLVLVPQYTHGTVSPSNATAISTWQAAMPGKTVVGINCQGIVTLAGVMHCIVMHVPAHLGGENPTAHLCTLRGGETLNPGDLATVRWISDDDVAVSNVDLLLSTDGGATWPTTIAAATADDGEFVWTVPDVHTTQARIRVVARDASGNTGSDDSPADFTIDGTRPGCPADLDGDASVGIADLAILLSNFGTASGATAGDGDLDGDEDVDISDLAVLLGAFGTPCP